MASWRAGSWWMAGGLLAAGIASPSHAAADLDSRSGPISPFTEPGKSAMSADRDPGIPLFGAAATLTDSELDALRGGFELPNGMDVVVGVDIQTLVNGTLALRSVLNSDTGTPVVFVGNGSGAVSSSGTGTGTAGGVVVHVGDATTTIQPVAGEQQVSLTPNGPAVSTPSGSVQLVKNDSGSQVILNGNSLELRQMIGSLTGSIVANTANDRTIDTVVTINVAVPNSGILVGNSLLRADSIALDTAGRGIR
ncbi:hypothetical protein EDF56_108108 [Novosphingobium sp. PhB165]|uniref:hypothetical protein n=1 Tax=Novosphingobium sp. PhB165 TaxID=2485105 RepID=UPI001043646E|nr:hypothetical protein [Novosphingobium sp. PhB165]TCM16120.1 hypothetical protein EDF56_108108 [Novosphingobium sp. PhB165]